MLNSEVRLIVNILEKPHCVYHARARMHGVYILNKGVWPNAHLQRRLVLVKDTGIECGHSDFNYNVMLRCWDPELAHECSDIRVMQGQRLLCIYTQNVPNSRERTIRRIKQYTLNSEYVLISNMCLIS